MNEAEDTTTLQCDEQSKGQLVPFVLSKTPRFKVADLFNIIDRFDRHPTVDTMISLASTEQSLQLVRTLEHMKQLADSGSYLTFIDIDSCLSSETIEQVLQKQVVQLRSRPEITNLAELMTIKVPSREPAYVKINNASNKKRNRKHY